MSTDTRINTNAFIYYLSVEIANNIKENNPKTISSICFHKRILTSLKEANKESKIFEIKKIDTISKSDIENAIHKNIKNIVKIVTNKIIDASPTKIERTTKEEIKLALKNSLNNPNNIESALARLKNAHTKLKDFNHTYQEAKIFSDNYQIEKNKATKSSNSDTMKIFKKMSTLIAVNLPVTWDLLSFEEKTIFKTQYKITDKEIQEIRKPLLEERFTMCIKLQDTIDKLFEELNQEWRETKIEEIKKEIQEKLKNLFILMKSSEGAKYREKHTMEVIALADKASSIGIQIDTSGN